MTKGTETPQKKKRPYGDGSVYQRADGRWESIARYTDPLTGEKHKKSFYGKGPKEVLGKKRAFEDDLKRGIVPKAGKLTVEDWLDDWLQTYKKNTVRQNTYEGYQRVINGHLKPTIGKKPLKDLRPEHVQKMLNNKMLNGNLRNEGTPLSARQVEYIYAVLHMALERALKNGLVSRNVCDVVDKPKKVKREFIPWNIKQTNKFLNSVKDIRLFPLYMVAWGTGLRRAEILGLQWTDVDLNKGTITVRRALVRVKGGYKFQEPKTDKSRRTVPLPTAVVDALKDWKKQQAKENMKWNGLHKDLPDDERPPYNPLNMVFCNELGEPINPEFISRSFKRDLKKAGLPEIRFHDLRHGHATMLLELGEDLKIISERLGHSTITLTADTYSHVREELQREASDRLDQVLFLRK